MTSAKAKVPRSISRSLVNRKPLYVYLILPLRTYIAPRGLLQLIQSFRWGLESIIVCETRDPRLHDPKSTALLTYTAGLKNSVYPYPLLKELFYKEFSPILGGELQCIKRKGWGTICAMFPELDCHPNLALWGISPEEFEARQYANTKKVGFHLAKLIISRTSKRAETTTTFPGPDTLASRAFGDFSTPPPTGRRDTQFVVTNTEEQLRFSNGQEAEAPPDLEAEDSTIYLDEGGLPERDESSALQQLRQYWQAHGAPVPYSEGELGPERSHVIQWLGHNLVTPRAIGEEQLLLLGTTQSERNSFVQLLAQMIHVCFLPPKLNNWSGADNAREITVIEGISDFSYSDAAEESCCCRTTLVRLLDGQPGLYEWGLRGENTFLNRVNTPVILVPHLPAVPTSLCSDLFSSRLRVAEWISPPPVGTISGGRLAATLLVAAERKTEGSTLDWAEYPSLVPLSRLI